MFDYTYRNVEEVLELSSQEMEQVQGGANVDYFLRIPGVEGEVTDDRAGSPHVRVINSSLIL